MSGWKYLFALFAAAPLVFTSASCNKIKPGTYYTKIESKKIRCENKDMPEDFKQKVELELRGDAKNKFEDSTLSIKNVSSAGTAAPVVVDLEGRIDSGDIVLTGRKYEHYYRLKLKPSATGFEGELRDEGNDSCKAKGILFTTKEPE